MPRLARATVVQTFVVVFFVILCATDWNIYVYEVGRHWIKDHIPMAIRLLVSAFGAGAAAVLVLLAARGKRQRATPGV